MFHFSMSFPAASPRSRPRFHGRRVSREEYLQLPDDGFRYDMIDGVLHVVPSADFQHGKRNGRFYWFLDEYLETHPYGEVTQETDILLPDGGDILCPDLCFVLNSNTGIIRTHVHGTPDLICEVLLCLIDYFYFRIAIFSIKKNIANKKAIFTLNGLWSLFVSGFHQLPKWNLSTIRGWK